MNDFKSRPNPEYLPNPWRTYEQRERFYHRDIPGLDVDTLGAESRLLQAEIDRLTFARYRPRLFHCDAPGDQWITDVDWLRERVKKLQLELTTRQRRRVA